MLRFAPTAQTVKDLSGVEYLVVKANSYTVRLASSVRRVVMQDGTEWTVGSSRARIGIAAPIAWRP
ncbi:hypothetical protein [Streptomyces abikoensis]|uniref:Uncharacterized protein n=1 Tax=Streptomyces abikoensis TaxID=97398 RepID=A0ABW7T9J9_9ACTN